jgi:acyl carrier protein
MFILDCPLFREGFGLDSIDALELALAIKQRYGLQIQANDRSNSHFNFFQLK